MIAPDEKTFAYLKGRPKSPKGEAWDQAVRLLGDARTDEGAHFDREVRLDAGATCRRSSPGAPAPRTSPRSPASCRRAEDAPDEQKRASIERALDYMGLKGGEKITDIDDRPRLHRLLHQWPHRGSARRRQGRRGQDGQRQRQRHGRAGIRPREGAGRGRGPRQDLHGRRLRLARAGLLDVPRHERRQARARRALRLDLEPQFRGPPGLSRAARISSRRRWPRRRRSPGTSSTSANGRWRGRDGRRKRSPPSDSACRASRPA